MGKESHPLVRKAAPPLTLPSVPDGNPYTLPIGQKPIALFFFPAAFTAGCTREACSFRDAKAENMTFKRHPELEVVGVSQDATAKQASFADQYTLPYPLVSDAEGKAIEAYQVERAFMGLAAGRATFFINAEGIVTGVCLKNIDFRAHTKFVEQQLLLLEKGSKTTAAA